MTRGIEHRSRFEFSAQRAYAALLDPAYLRERLRELGGDEAELLSHDRTADGARFQLRQSVRGTALPAPVRSVVGGHLKIDRSESWRRADVGHFVGETSAEVAGVPCAITGSMWLRELPEEGGSELVTEGQIEVSLPFVGSKLENLAAEQVNRLRTAEDQFLSDWLARAA